MDEDRECPACGADIIGNDPHGPGCPRDRGTSDCRWCHRHVEQDTDGAWIDPEATGDDAVWREVCDSHDTFTAEHEPTVADDGIRIVWLPVNQAWMVLWHDSRLAGPLNDRAEAEEYVRELRATVAAHPAGKGQER